MRGLKMAAGEQYLRIPMSSPEHAQALHPYGSSGFVIVCESNGRWVQYSFLPHEVKTGLESLNLTGNAYITQGRFWRANRAIVNVREMGAVWVDLDYYKHPDFANCHPEYFYDLCVERCFEQKIPEPSLGIFSGRGMYLVWLHAPIEKRDLAHWNYLQGCLHDAFSDMGSDKGAMDAARVLRLIGTTNTKSQKSVRCIGGRLDVWLFNDLFFEISGYEKGKQPGNKKPENKIVSLGVYKSKRKPKTYRGAYHNHKTLYAARLQDLEALIAYRWPNGVPEGYRNNIAFLLAVFLSWIVEPLFLQREWEACCRRVQFIGYTEREFQQTFHAVKKRMQMYSAGKKVLWNGQWRDPRYRYTNQTLIDLLGITEHEMIVCGLRSLATPEIIRKNKVAAKREARRRAGILSREDWLKSDKSNPDSLESQKPWEKLGISRRHYYRLKAAGKLKEKDKKSNVTGSDPVYEGV